MADGQQHLHSDIMYYGVYLFADSLRLDRNRFVCAMFLQDADGTDAALTGPTVHLGSERITEKAAQLSVGFKHSKWPTGNIR